MPHPTVEVVICPNVGLHLLQYSGESDIVAAQGVLAHSLVILHGLQA